MTDSYYEERIHVGDIVRLSSLCAISEDYVKDCEGIYNHIDDEVRDATRTRQLFKIIDRCEVPTSEYEISSNNDSSFPRYKYVLKGLDDKTLSQKLSYGMLECFRTLYCDCRVNVGDDVMYNTNCIVWSRILSLFDEISPEIPATFLGIDLLGKNFHYRKDYILKIISTDSFYYYLSDGTKVVKELLIPASEIHLKGYNVDNLPYNIGDFIYTYKSSTSNIWDVEVAAFCLNNDSVIVKDIVTGAILSTHRYCLKLKSPKVKPKGNGLLDAMTYNDKKEDLVIAEPDILQFKNPNTWYNTPKTKKLTFNFKTNEDN